MAPNAHRSRLPHGRLASAFTLAEMLVVMAIISILAASLAIILPKLRSRAMTKRAESDIHLISDALQHYHSDIGYYPVAPYVNSSTPFADRVLYQALTNRDYNGANVGWGGANTEWKFLSDASRTSLHILDPWGVPYYYIAHPDYLRGVRIDDPTDATLQGNPNRPNCYGTTEAINDFQSAGNHLDPPANYYGPPPSLNAFYNPTTFQIHSKGPDQLTDIEDGDPGVIDGCDRGTDADDVNNFGK